jgi:3-methyladenine DNA glycosylase AlkD
MKKIAMEIHRSLSAIKTKNATSFRFLRREWSKQLQNRPGKAIISLARNLVPLGFWERIMAYEIILYHRGAQQDLRSTDIAVLGRGMNSWAEVDSFASYVAGPAWRERRIPDSVVSRWAHSPNRWWRRAALVSTVPLNNRARGGTGDTSRTLRICRLLVNERDDMVIKALSWSLRELSKRDRAAVKMFLNKYLKLLASRIKREVQNKLDTGLKNRRRSRSSLQVRHNHSLPNE